MRKIVTVAVREFVETIKTKTFIISTVFMPMLIVLIMLMTERIAEVAENEPQPMRTVAVIDETGRLEPFLHSEFGTYNSEHPMRRMEIELIPPDAAAADHLRERVHRGEIYAYVRVPAEASRGEAACELGAQDSQIETQRRIQRLVESAIVSLRFASADPPIERSRVEQLQADVPFRVVDVRTGRDATGNELVRFMTPFAFMFLLFMGTLNISQGLLTGLIEEKSSRVIEVLLSAVSPTQLMAGKILGMVSIGALLMVIWAGTGYYAAQSRGMGYLVQVYQLQYLALYFVPGFLLMSAILAAIGSACNTIKDAQSLAFPVTLITIVPMMLWWQIAMNPNSTFSIVLSYIPPITPFIMILRICADPKTPLLEIIATLVLLWASVGAAIWVAGRVFRVGVLMYGKAPTPAEMLRWVRYR
ncbi:MAG: ABC transporter permease [Phycisphaerae bacterium]|jgi:ABC-2 type transport system permease protein